MVTGHPDPARAIPLRPVCDRLSSCCIYQLLGKVEVVRKVSTGRGGFVPVDRVGTDYEHDRPVIELASFLGGSREQPLAAVLLGQLGTEHHQPTYRLNAVVR